MKTYRHYPDTGDVSHCTAPVTFTPRQQQFLDTLIRRAQAKIAVKFETVIADLTAQRDRLIADKGELIIEGYLRSQIANYPFRDVDMVIAALRSKLSFRDGVITVTGTSGEPLLNMDGTAVTVPQLLSKIAEDKPWMLTTHDSGQGAQ